jgi:hypothetical protein
MGQVYTALVFPLILLVGQAIVALGQRKIGQRMDEGQAKTDAKRKAEAEWRDSIDKRLNDMEDKLDELEKKQNRSISQQAVQIRSDIVHKCHRYLDDLGRASSEEKETLNDAYEKYGEFCEDLDMENDFIDLLVQRVMELPEREV